MVIAVRDSKQLKLAFVLLFLTLLTAGTALTSGPAMHARTGASSSLDTRVTPADHMSYTVYRTNVSGYDYDDRIMDAASAYSEFGPEAYVYIVGYVSETPTALSTDIYVAKVNVSGNVVWERQWGLPGEAEFGYGITIDFNLGRIWVVGGRGSTSVGSMVLLSYDKDGNLILSKTITNGDGKGLVGYSVFSDNCWNSVQGIYVVGKRCEGSATNYSIALFKFRASDGVELWNRTFWYDSADAAGKGVVASAGSSTKSVITVGGYVTNATTHDKNAILLRYDQNGNLLWNRIWGDPNDDEIVEGLAHESYFSDSYLYGCGVDGGHGALWKFNNGTGTVYTMRTRADTSHLYDIHTLKHDVNGTYTSFIYTVGTVQNSGQDDILFWKMAVSDLTDDGELVWDSGYTDWGYGVGVARSSTSEELFVLLAGTSVDNMGQAPMYQFARVVASQDYDSDGLSNALENEIGTAYNDADTDDDGMPDGWEYSYGLDPRVKNAGGDPDSDGLINLYEYGNGTIPTDSDTEDDGMPDGWEVTYGLDPLSDDAMADLDSDQLKNIYEYGNGTLPNNNDTDSDRMPDGYEVFHHLNPLSNDTGGDYDSDGATNYQEYLIGTLPDDSDTDNDLMPDGWEIANSTDPLNYDADADPDNDGLTNLGEYLNGTLPNNNDTDSDGLPDGYEIQYGLNPLHDDASGDLDNDGLTNYQEYQGGTDPSVDDVAPVINSVNRDPAAVVTDADDVVIYVDAYDHNGIQLVYVMSNYTGEWVNYTATYDSASGLYTYTVPAQTAGVTVAYRVFVEDLGGNWAATSTVTYTVTQSTTSTTSTTQTTGTTTTSTPGLPGGQLLSADLLMELGIVAVVLVLIGVIIKARRRS